MNEFPAIVSLTKNTNYIKSCLWDPTSIKNMYESTHNLETSTLAPVTVWLYTVPGIITITLSLASPQKQVRQKIQVVIAMKTYYLHNKQGI
jgi:hypothetical protein